MENDTRLLKVAANSRSTLVAGAIAGMIREGKSPIIQAIGAGAVNQGVKAIAIARGYLEAEHIDLTFVPTFHELEVNGQERTAIRLEISRK